MRRDTATHDFYVTLHVTELDMIRVKLDRGDQAVLADCDNEEATIADRLFGLELLARRIEESVDNPEG